MREYIISKFIIGGVALPFKFIGKKVETEPRNLKKKKGIQELTLDT